MKKFYQTKKEQLKVKKTFYKSCWQGYQQLSYYYHKIAILFI
ncbi:hypothetical protein Bateq7PJ16_1921 [Bacillus subtilis]|nr:hypothetical protein Bateq7PJ16_1921 [Bacillus subtilis]RAP05809.1 hypothetical protein HS3_02497 [Bacillus subtilis]RPK01177.1 hypothetical protein EH11_03361 [Bacillus subtilis]RUS07255.1 hypothetical protein EFW59_03369 [Bacillus subtilis]